MKKNIGSALTLYPTPVVVVGTMMGRKPNWMLVAHIGLIGHPYYQEPDVVPYIQELGITVQGWYPFGGRGHTSELLGDETISAIAEAHGVTSAQVILRWNLQRGVVVIPGSSNPDHIRENLDLFGFELTEEEMAQIAALNRDEKHDWY